MILCCSFCNTECECGHCESEISDFEKYGTESSSESEEGCLVRHVDDKEQSCLRLELLELKDSLDKDVMLEHTAYTRPDLIHGLTVEVVDQIVSKAKFIFSVDDLIKMCHILQYSTACQIIHCFSHVFSDMDLNLESQIDTDFGTYA